MSSEAVIDELTELLTPTNHIARSVHNESEPLFFAALRAVAELPGAQRTLQYKVPAAFNYYVCEVWQVEQRCVLPPCVSGRVANAWLSALAQQMAQNHGQHVLNLPLRIKRLVRAVMLCAFCAAGLPRPGRKQFGALARGMSEVLLKGDALSVFAAPVYEVQQQPGQQQADERRAELAASLLSAPVHHCMSRVQRQCLAQLQTDQDYLLPVRQGANPISYMYARIEELVQACSDVHALVVVLKDALFAVQPCSIQEVGAVALQASQIAHRICGWATHLHAMATHVAPGTAGHAAFVMHLWVVGIQSLDVYNQLQRMQPRHVTGPVSPVDVVQARSASAFALQGSSNACLCVSTACAYIQGLAAAAAGAAAAAAEMAAPAQAVAPPPTTAAVPVVCGPATLSGNTPARSDPQTTAACTLASALVRDVGCGLQASEHALRCAVNRRKLAAAAECVRSEQLAGQLHACLTSPGDAAAVLLTPLARVCSSVLSHSTLQRGHVVLQYADLLVKRDRLHAALQQRPQGRPPAPQQAQTRQQRRQQQRQQRQGGGQVQAGVATAVLPPVARAHRQSRRAADKVDAARQYNAAQTARQDLQCVQNALFVRLRQLAAPPHRPLPTPLQLRQCFTQLRRAVCLLDTCEAKLVEGAVAAERMHGEAAAADAYEQLSAHLARRQCCTTADQPHSQQAQRAREAAVREACAAARLCMRQALEHARLVAPVLGVCLAAPTVPEFGVWAGTPDALLHECGDEAQSVWQWVMGMCLGVLLLHAADAGAESAAAGAPARAAAPGLLKGVIQQVNKIEAQWRSCHNALQRLTHSVTPHPHYGFTHLHFTPTLLKFLRTAVSRMSLAERDAWRLWRQQQRGVDPPPVAAVDTVGAICDAAAEDIASDKDCFSLLFDVDRLKVLCGERGDSEGRRSFARHVTTDCVSLHVHAAHNNVKCATRSAGRSLDGQQKARRARQRVTEAAALGRARQAVGRAIGLPTADTTSVYVFGGGDDDYNTVCSTVAAASRSRHEHVRMLDGDWHVLVARDAAGGPAVVTHVPAQALPKQAKRKNDRLAQQRDDPPASDPAEGVPVEEWDLASDYSVDRSSYDFSDSDLDDEKLFVESGYASCAPAAGQAALAYGNCMPAVSDSRVLTVEAGCGLRVTGVDPGVTSIVTAVTANHGVRGDGEDGGDGWMYSVNGREYRSACGLVRQRHWLHGRVKRAGVTLLLKHLQTVGKKHGQHDAFVVYAREAIATFPQLHAVYGCRTARHHRFRIGMLQDRQLHRMCQCLALGHTGVQGRRWQKPKDHNAGLPVSRPSVAVVCMGDASAGWGGPVSRSISAPVVKLREFFRAQYGSPDGVARGGCIDMHWVSVHEYRTSQTCSRCYDARGLKQYRKGRFKLKQCAHGEAVLAPDRLQAQLHDVVVGEDDQPRRVPLVLDRDVNAARVLTARGVAQLVPACCVHQGQLQQLACCVDRVVRKDWLNQRQRQRQEEEAAEAGDGGVGGMAAMAEVADGVALAGACMVCVIGHPVPFMPCGHAVLCSQCGAGLLNGQCPICQSLVSGLGQFEVV